MTGIGLSPLPGISTLVSGGYVEPSGFFGVTVTSPVLGSWFNSNVGVIDCVTLTVDVNSALCPTLLTDMTFT